MRISDWSSDVCSSDLYRFKDAAWEENFLFDYIKQSYLVTSRWLQSTVHDMDGDMDEKTKRKVEFYTRKFVDAMAHSNFAMNNPAVLRATVERHIDSESGRAGGCQNVYTYGEAVS